MNLGTLATSARVIAGGTYGGEFMRPRRRQHAVEVSSSGPASLIPGNIEAELFDNGGDGVAYKQTDLTNKAQVGLRVWVGGLVDVDGTFDGSVSWCGRRIVAVDNNGKRPATWAATWYKTLKARRARKKGTTYPTRSMLAVSSSLKSARSLTSGESALRRPVEPSPRTSVAFHKDNSCCAFFLARELFQSLLCCFGRGGWP